LPQAGEVLPQAGEVLPQAGEVLPQAGEVLPQAGEAFVAAKRPSRRTPFEEQLAIAYPRSDPDPTPAERHACAVILINARLMDAIHNAIDQHLRQGDRVNDPLKLHCFRAVSQYISELHPLRTRIQEGAAAGKADLHALQK